MRAALFHLTQIGSGVAVLALVAGACGRTERSPDGPSTANGGETLTTTSGGSRGTGAMTSDSSDTGTQAGAEASTTGGTPPDLPESFLACTVNSDCTVTAQDCCADCAHLSRDTSIAIALASVDAYHERECAPDTACKRCTPIPDHNLFARCNSGRCELVDISTTPISACSASNDCKLRSTRCCECDLSASLVAIAVDQEKAFQTLACDANETCPPCTDPPQLLDVAALCSEERCIVRGFF